MGQLPGCDSVNKDFFTRHLHKSRIIRNKFAHKEKILPDNIADALVLARFKLYSYLAATLCLRKNKPQIETRLLVKDDSRTKDAQFKVWEVTKGGLSKELDMKPSPFGYEFTLERFHTYKVEVSGKEQAIELTLQWYSYSPSCTWDGIKLTPHDNDNEMIAHNPSGTLNSVLDMNERIESTLANIDKTIREGTKDQKEQMSQVIKNLIILQQNQTKLQQMVALSKQEQTEANKEEQKQLIQINTNLAEHTTTLAKISESIDGNNHSSQEMVATFNAMADNIARLTESVTRLLESNIEKKKQQEKNDTIWLFVKRLPIWIALCAAVIGCFLHFIHPRTIYWMTLKPLYISVLVLGPILLIAWLLWVYHTTKKKALITQRIKTADWNAIALSAILWGAAIVVTPHPTEEEYILYFSWSSNEKICQKFIHYVEDFLKKNPESEVARSKLAEYYLDIADDLGKALEVTDPMTDVKKYPTGCVYAAEALYRNDDFIRVKDIIDDYSKFHPGYSRLGLDRLNALLLIDGRIYDRPDPDSGLMILHKLAERGDYTKASYDLGHWSATDLAEWKPGATEVVALRYDLPTAVKYLRRVADCMPKAALELGNLYADIGVIDSAKHYIGLALTQAKGDLYSKALYCMGLLEESQGDSLNRPMKEAIDRGYAPAIEHKAIMERNYRAAIERMRVAGRYKGHRTIPPIVFEYLKATEIRNFTGLADSALKVLQDQRPECHFNRTFISAMDAAIGTSRMKKDVDSAWVLLRKSSEEGCLYAKMMCCYQDAITEMANGSRSIYIEPLYNILPTIPFAGVLLSDLFIRVGKYGEAIKAAQYPIAKNNPAAALILSSIPSSYNIWTDKESFSGLDDIHKELLNSYIIQKIVRLSPHKNRWLMDCFTSDATKRSLFREKPDSSQISIFWQKINKHTNTKAMPDSYFVNNNEGAQLWVDAISASYNVTAKLNAALWAVTDTLHREKLVRSALYDLKKNKNCPKELWQMWLWCIGFCSVDFQLAIYDEGDNTFKRRYDEWVNQIRSKVAPSKPQFLPDVETVQLSQISINAQFDELSTIISEFRQHRRLERNPQQRE